MYFTVLGDMRAALSAKEIFVIAKEVFASLLGQSFVLAKIIKPKIPDQDAARSFVILLPAKRSPKIEVWKSHRPLRTLSLSFDEPKATKHVLHSKPIFNFEILPVPLWNFDDLCFTRELLTLFCQLTVELGQSPKEPVRIPNDYFGEGFALIFAKPHRAPMHVSTFHLAVLYEFASDDHDF
jgi:hypothetical protein